MSALRISLPFVNRLGRGTSKSTLGRTNSIYRSTLPCTSHLSHYTTAQKGRASLVEREHCLGRSILWQRKVFRPALAAMQIRAASADGALPIREMDVGQLQELLKAVNQDNARDVQLIDVREEFEHEIASLPGFRLLPLSRFQEWGPIVKETLDPQKETVVLCHHGVRSMRASAFLASQGFENVSNVTGGIDAYSRQIDSSVPFY